LCDAKLQLKIALQCAVQSLLPLRYRKHDLPGARDKTPMRMKHVEQTVLMTLFAGACFAFAGACLGIGRADGATLSTSPMSLRGPGYLQLAQSTLLPEAAENPISPATPGTLPGTTAGSGLGTGTNPITGQPCSGEGSTALLGGINGVDENGVATNPDTTPGGLPPEESVYGSSYNLGAC
jgi:hypothetical protein